jgi:tyrosine-specific transport protein
MSLVLRTKENIFGATLLVTGCCIGAGMIGLPVLSLIAGFVPSTIAMILSYLFTTATGLLLLEATLWFKEKTNLLSIAQFTLGKIGKFLAGGLFLFLFYSIFIAYMDGGGQLFRAFFETIFQTSLPREVGIVTFVIFVGLIIYTGIQTIDQINKTLIVGLAISYLAMVFIGLPYVDLQNFSHFNWKASLSTLPILFICFGYQNLVPTLVHYLRRDIQAIRAAIVIGNLIPLFFYVLWNFVILGMLSPKIASSNVMVTDLLKQTTDSSSIVFFSQSFSFFALTTSFIAISISFIDFFKDALKNTYFNREILYNFFILNLVFTPPLIFCLFYPNVFLKALVFAGGFVDVLLFGIFPVLIIWSGRYIKKLEGPYKMWGGKTSLMILLLLSVALLTLQWN